VRRSRGIDQRHLGERGLGREQGGGNVGDGVRRESSVIGGKLVRRRKQDGLGRWG